jgi:hypothetical protein
MMQFDVTATIPVLGAHWETRLVVADNFDGAYEWAKQALEDREFFLEADSYDVSLGEIMSIEFAGHEDEE